MVRWPEFLIVGAGSAGCVVAAELARQGRSVWLVESGSNTASLPPTLNRPADYLRTFGGNQDWNFSTIRQAALARRSIRWPRGKGIGGSSLINAMIFYPPLHSDWACWEPFVGERWTTASMLSWQSRLMHACHEWIEPLRSVSAATHTAIQAAAEHWGENAFHVHQVMCRQGHRVTPRQIFDLEGWQQRGHLRLVPNLTAEKLIVESQRVCGLVTAEGEEIYAESGVILTAGTIGSPRLLIASGLGPQSIFKELGVECRSEMPSVGEDLQDHLVVPSVASLETRFRFPTSWSALQRRQHRMLGRGAMASNLAEASGLFSRSGKANASEDPAFLCFVTPTHYLLHPQPNAPSAMTLAVVGCRPKSRGQLMFRSEAGKVTVEIDPGYLTHSEDLEVLQAGLLQMRTLWSHQSLARIRAREVLPGPDRLDASALERYISRYAQTLYHPVGTCRMGSDSRSVTDSRGAVRGVEGLWIADASVFPRIPAVNPQVMVMTVALRIAQEIMDCES